MKQILTLFFTLISLAVFTQNDTTIYKVVSEMPRFPGCEQLDTTIEVKTQCAQARLLMFFNQNMAYPWDAREQDIEGTVVLSMVVEKDGYISNPTVVRDIGGGCGDEAIRVAGGMNDALKSVGMKWTPGMKDGKPVRTQVTVPIKFKLEDPLDFVIVDFRDTVYVVVDDSLKYTGGEAALDNFIKNNLKTPATYRDSCKIGTMDMTLLVRPSGYVRVLDLADYWGLGWDFQWEAIRAATATWGKWQPAVRLEKQVPSSIDLTITFLPNAAKCAQTISNYEKADALAGEGSNLFNEGKQAEGVAKLTEALALFPKNANFLYLRGQAYMNMNEIEKACADFLKVREMVTIDVVNQLIPVLCK